MDEVNPCSRSWRALVSGLFLSLVLLAGCSLPFLPRSPELPQIPGMPDLPDLGQLPDLLRDLELPDLSGIPGLPQLSDLPGVDLGPNAIAFAGPTERRLAIGDRIPGTDIQLVAIGQQGPEFRIAGLRSVRAVGDSLDFDGDWPGIQGVRYSLRLRIYRVGEDSVRVAGVHRLVVEGIQPQAMPVALSGTVLKVPYTGSARVGETLKGLTYGYGGQEERGARVTGIPQEEYPYRKVGDSLRWSGYLRPDIPIEYNLRVAFVGQERFQVVGVASLQLP